MIASEETSFSCCSACLGETFPVVLAFSASRSGMAAPKYVQSLRAFLTPWMWKPSTVEETEKFGNKLDYKCDKITTKQLFNITCGNPRFLLQCSHLTTLNVMISEISEMVEHLVGKLLEKAEKPLLSWISGQLEETRRMLVKVADGDAIPCANYMQTWGWKPSLVYKKSSTDDGDTLGLSYPDVIHKIFTVVRRRYQENCHHRCTVFFFEYYLLDSLKRLSVVYIKGEGDDPEMETSFTIQGCLSVMI